MTESETRYVRFVNLLRLFQQVPDDIDQAQSLLAARIDRAGDAQGGPTASLFSWVMDPDQDLIDAINSFGASTITKQYIGIGRAAASQDMDGVEDGLSLVEIWVTDDLDEMIHDANTFGLPIEQLGIVDLDTGNVMVPMPGANVGMAEDGTVYVHARGSFSQSDWGRPAFEQDDK